MFSDGCNDLADEGGLVEARDHRRAFAPPVRNGAAGEAVPDDRLCGCGMQGVHLIRNQDITPQKYVAPRLQANFNVVVTVGNYSPTEADLVSTGAKQARLHDLAAQTARQQFGNRVFVRAVVEVSNFCRENCSYCGMRRDNRSLARFRAGHEQLADLLLRHFPACVTDINIQAGEDPVAVRKVALPLIEVLRKNTALGISVCLGTLSRSLYTELQAAGASIYIIKFECSNSAEYERLNAPGTLA